MIWYFFKKHWLRYSFFILIPLVFGLCGYLNTDKEMVGNVLVLLSIMAGFNITALSVVANSNFSKKLYNTEDKDMPGTNNLSQLVDLFKENIYLNVFTIVLSVAYYQFLIVENVTNVTFLLEGINTAYFVLVTFNLIVMVSLVSLYSELTKQSGKA